MMKSASESRLMKDVIASLPVFFLAVPLCLGIAHACGLPLMAGLMSGIIGGLVVGAISSSRVGVAAPSAGLVAVILASMHDLNSFPLFLISVMVAGLIQMGLGAMQAGFLVRFVPNSVMKGMLCAIGLILILKEIPHFVGYDIEEFGLVDFFLNPESLSAQYPQVGITEGFNTFTLIGHSLSFFHLGSLLVALASLTTMIVWSKTPLRKLRFIPPALATLVVGVGTSLILKWIGGDVVLDGKHLVNLPGIASFGEFTSFFSTPDWSGLLHLKTYKVALMLAIVLSIESLLTVEVLDRMDPQRHRTSMNRELFAQGIGNLFAGAVGALPMTSNLPRGTVNLNSGAQTNRAAIFQGLWILISVAFFSSMMNLIPIACLSVILIVTGWRLIDFKLFKDFYRRGYYQFIPFMITIFGILFVDLLVGIVLGMVSAFLFILRTSYYDSAFQIVRMGRVHRIFLGEDVSFLLKAKLLYELRQIPNDSLVEIDGSKSIHIDVEILEVIQSFKEEAKLKNIQVVTGGIKALSEKQPEVYEEMNKEYQTLIENNKEWVKEKTNEDPEFFNKLSKGQSPQFLFIGCSDSRVPLETITKSNPGDMFIHRNIANIVNLSDVNFLSVLQYSVEVLNVRHIIVCGHYQCGGVKAALSHKSLGLIDNWILNVKNSVKDHELVLEKIEDPEAREQKAIELHVISQVMNLHKNQIVQAARAKYGFPDIHGWVYDIKTGLVKDLSENQDHEGDIESIFRFT